MQGSDFFSLHYYETRTPNNASKKKKNSENFLFSLRIGSSQISKSFTPEKFKKIILRKYLKLS